LQNLIDNERFTEALACKIHLEAQKEEQQVSIDYKTAKEEDRLEDALLLRNKLQILKEKIVSEDVIKTWKSQSTIKTLTSMKDALVSKVGATKAAPFTNKFSKTIISLANKDLDKAIALQLEASNLMETIISGKSKPTISQDMINQWNKTLENVSTELKNAKKYIDKVFSKNNKAVAELVMKSQQYQNYTKGLTAVYAVAQRIQKTIISQNVNNSNLSSLLQRITEDWKTIRSSMNLQDYSLPTINDSDKNCTLCLLPLTNSDKILQHNGSHYHFGCNKYFINRVVSGF